MEEVQRIFASRTKDEWVELMKDHDACCEAVISLTEAADSALVEARKMVNQALQGGVHLTSVLIVIQTTLCPLFPLDKLFLSYFMNLTK